MDNTNEYKVSKYYEGIIKRACKARIKIYESYLSTLESNGEHLKIKEKSLLAAIENNKG